MMIIIFIFNFLLLAFVFCLFFLKLKKVFQTRTISGQSNSKNESANGILKSKENGVKEI